MNKTMMILAATIALGLAASPAAATGKMSCKAPQASWKSMDALKAKLTGEGWAVRKAKVDGGCYEVYGTDPEGRSVEAYFDPASFKKLLVSRRGQVLFRAK
jgi:hypothetical protein